MQHFRVILVMMFLFCPFGALFCNLALAQEEKGSPGKIIPRLIPGTQVNMGIPELFELDPGTGAYIYAGAAASIILKEMRGVSFQSLAASLSDETFSGQGMTVEKTENLITRNGTRATLFKTLMNIQSQEEDKKVEYRRMIFIAGNQENAVLVTVNYPLITEKVMEDPVRSCLLSVEF